MRLFNIQPTTGALAHELQTKIDGKTKPLGALGQLESLAKQIGLIQQTASPQLTSPQMLVFAGDHGAAKAGVSAYPQDVTWQMVENFLAGGAAINVFTRTYGLPLAVVDCGVAHEFGTRPDLIDCKLGAGTENYLEHPAMTTAQYQQAIENGTTLVAGCADKGCNVIGLGEMGIGNTASASLLTHCLSGEPLDVCVGRGTGLDDAGLNRKQQLLAQALERTGNITDPAHALQEFGGFEIATMVGVILAAAERRMVVLIDGFVVGAAALVACKLYPAARDYCVYCHRSAEAGHRVQLAAMQAEPLLDLGMRLGEGTGVALAWPLIRGAVAFINDMASFASAGVSEKA
jgi:nicotinate-nucleotide--dimethylbenzimidazole phosphoribosyltransferase